jgi:hypothetical protein
MPPPFNSSPTLPFPTVSFSQGAQQSPTIANSAMLGHFVISSQAAVPAHLATRQPPPLAEQQHEGGEKEKEVVEGKKITAILGYEMADYWHGQDPRVEYCSEKRWQYLYDCDADFFVHVRPDDDVKVPTEDFKWWAEKVCTWDGKEKKYLTVWDDTTGKDKDEITVKVGNIKEHISTILQGTHFISSGTLTKKEFDKWFIVRTQTGWFLPAFLNLNLEKYKDVLRFVKAGCEELIILNNERLLFELVLENRKPLLVSLVLSRALQQYSRRVRSKNMRLAGSAGELAAALEELARAVARSTRALVEDWFERDVKNAQKCLEFLALSWTEVGCKKPIVWKDVGSEKPKTGTEIKNDDLAKKVEKKKEEWGKVELQEADLLSDSYIKAGYRYYTPVKLFPIKDFENENRMRNFSRGKDFSVPSWLKGVASVQELSSKLDQKRTELEENEKLYEQEIYESMEFATTHGLKAFVSESKIVSLVENRWSGFSDGFVAPDGLDEHIGKFVPDFLDPSQYDGFKEFCWVVLLVIYCVLVLPLALVTFPWPPGWRFWAFQLSYIVFALFLWSLPVLGNNPQDDVNYPSDEGIAAVLLMTHLWAELSQLFRIAGKAQGIKDVFLRYTQDPWNCVDAVAMLTATAAGVARACLLGGVGFLSPVTTSDLHMYAIVLVWMRIMTFLQTFSFSGSQDDVP